MSNLSPKFTPTDYASAKRAHERHGNVTLCYATTFTRSGGSYVIRHHGTDIVTYSPDGTIRLYGAGWASRTTADRMHRFTPPNVRVSSAGGDLTVTVDGVRVGSAVYGITVDHESEV